MDNTNKLPTIPTGEELEAIPRMFLEEDGWLDATIDDELLDVTHDYPIRYSLSINGTPFAPLGGLQCQTGQPGHGKTMTLSMVAAAILGDTTHGLKWLLTDEIPHPKVLYIDTEMERGNTMLVHKRICAMLGRDPHTPHDDLIILCLREVTTAEDRWRKVLKAIYLYMPNVVILDGLIDVVADFNDNVNCQELIFKCMACASHYGISFWTLLHENPGSTKMVGHAGSFLERKASDVMVTKKVKDEVTGKISFEVTNKKVRGKDWESYLFRVNDMPPYSFGIPELVNNAEFDEPEQEVSIDTDNLSKEQLIQLQMLVTDANGVTTRTMREGTKQMFGVGSAKADRILEDAVDRGILIKSSNKKFYKPSEDEEVPF